MFVPAGNGSHSKAHQMNSMSVIPQPQEVVSQWTADLSSRTSSSLSSPGDRDTTREISSDCEPTSRITELPTEISYSVKSSRQSSITDNTPRSEQTTPAPNKLLDNMGNSRVRSAPSRPNGWGGALSFDAVATPQRNAIGTKWRIAVSSS